MPDETSDDNQTNHPPTFTNISFILLLFGKGSPQSYVHLTYRQYSRRKGEAPNALAQRRERCQDVQNFFGQESGRSEGQVRRQQDSRGQLHHRETQSQKHFSFIAEDFVPERRANQGRERRQLRAWRRHHDSRLPEQGPRIPL